MDWNNRYTAYFDFCDRASQDIKLFDDFKRHKDVTDMLEHVSYQTGLEYIHHIDTYYPYLLDGIEDFAMNDSVGNPVKYYYDELGIDISPSTLRYIKVLGDLINLCGEINNTDIIEVGGGYGGQCRIVYEWCKPKSYTIIDHPSVLKLTDRYLHEFDIKRSEGISKFDLFISNYAFTEIDRVYQNLYKSQYIEESKKGYITCNWFGIRPDNGMTKDEILKLRYNGQFIPEVPLTGHNNCIYIW